jgi:cation-transporting ATPase I
VGELKDPLTPVLLVGAAASAVLGSGVDSALVGGVTAGNAIVGGVQRLRTERALHALLLRERRSGRRAEWRPGDPLPERPDDPALATALVAADELRPGDLISLRQSDVVPADARIVLADALEVDESTLTGESLPVSKDTAATVATALAERSSMLYEGTTVVAGTALAVVVAVGEQTEAGRAAAAAGGAKPAVGVQARLGDVTGVALPITGLGGLAVTGLSMLRGARLREALGAGVAVAVAAVPEGLPLVATVAQLAAARRLSARGVLVRSPRTLEALGRVDVLCFDKTGTLTQGRLEVVRAAALERDLDLGDGQGKRLLTLAARACPLPGRSRITHATDQAILDAAGVAQGSAGWELIEELPFQNGRGYSASLVRADGELSLAVKGAPEVVLANCSQVIARNDHTPEPLTQQRLDAARATVERLAADGLRVLAVAEGAPPGAGDAGERPGIPEPVTGLTLAGFVAIADVMRPDAALITEELTSSGVRAVMITGDHPRTASAIARKAGIPCPDDVITGAELDQLPERERLDRVGRAAVFARVSPEQKLRIVADLRRAGHVVAMTGDGTNDAAAIRLADAGIGVAAHGSTAARSASDLVLPGSDIARITDALREGRSLWRSVSQAVSILVGGNAGEVAFILLGTAIGGRSPLNTRQLLLVNMLTDMFPALAVALGTSPNGRDPGGAPSGSLLGPPLARAIAVRGGATAAGALLAWTGGRLTGRGRRASTMGLSALIATQLGQTLLANTRSPVVIVTCGASAAALVLIVNTPGVSQFFGCTPLGPVGWGIVAASSAAGTATAVLAPRLIPALAGPAGPGSPDG